MEAERDDVDGQIIFSFLLSLELQLTGSSAGTWSGQVGQSGVNRDHPEACLPQSTTYCAFVHVWPTHKSYKHLFILLIYLFLSVASGTGFLL